MSLEQFRGYDAWKTRTPYDDEQEHHVDCPCHEDADEVYECGGHGEHFCSVISREIDGCELVEPECSCPTRAEMEMDRAEFRRDCEMDR